MATEYAWDIDVPAPNRCPFCNGLATILPNVEPSEHLQEDIIDGVYRVVLYRHVGCRCKACDCLVQQPGQGEILLSRIGPGLRSKAIYLRNVIGISYRKVPRAIEELFGITFTPAALIGFEFIHFQFSTTREGEVSRNILGADFTGTLVTDCYSAYFAQVAGAKQKCLVHIARTARDWQKLVEMDSIDYQ